jgi:PAS domain S-box-containing protein
MNTSVSHLTLVAVLTLALFLGFLNFLLWRVQRQDRTPLWLAAWLTTSAVLAFCRLLQYTSLSEPMYILFPRILLTAGYTLAWIGYELANTFIGYHPPRWERALLVSAVALPILLLWTSNLILTDQILVRRFLFGGAFHGVETGSLYLPVSFLFIGLGTIPLFRLLSAHDSHRRENLWMAMGYLIVILFSLNDFIATSFNYAWIRLSDYSYLPMVIFFSNPQVQRFGQLYRGMGVMVRERTAELGEANETLRAEIIERRQVEETIKENEDRYRHLVEHSPYGIVIHIQDKIAYANPTAVRLIGAKTIEELIGKSIMDFVHPDSRPGVLQRLGEINAGKDVPTHQEKFICLDGRVIDVEVAGYPFIYQNKAAVQVVFHDITERKQAEEKILRQAAEMTLLYETTHDLVIEQNLPKLLTSIVERAVGLLKASSGGLYLCDSNQRQVRCVVSYNTLRDYTGVVLKYGEGAAGLVAETGEHLIIEDYRTWEGRAAEYEQDQPFISLLSVPMYWQDRVIGILHVLENTKPRVFTQEELLILTLFANQAAIAVENSRLFEFEQRRHHESAAILEVGRDISASLQLGVVLERIASHAKELLGVETSAVYLAEPTKPFLKAIAAIGPDAEEIKQDPLNIGEGILGNIAVQKAGEIVNNSTADNRGITIKGTINFPYEHLMGVPVLSRDQLTGLIAVWRTGKGQEFNAADLDFLVSLAQQAAIAIENAGLFEDTRRRLAELVILQTIASTLRVAQTPEEAFPIILDQLVNLLDVGSASVELLDPTGQEIVTVLAHGVWAPVTGLRSPANIGLSGMVISTNQPYVTNNVIEDGFVYRPDLVGGLNAVACVPIVAQHQPIGTLWVGRQIQPITREEINLLVALGEMLGNTFQRMQLHEQTVYQSEEIALAYDLTLEGWASALELHDKETAGHSRRITELTLQLGRRLGVPETEMTHIRRGILLHDIGKMGISDQLLKKAGPLTEDEWCEMRKHPQYAYDLLHPIIYLRPALDIPYCHHEHWDGNGYPRGLKGEQIPLAARIFAIVDVFDALSNDRPYRAAWPRQEVLNYVGNQAGKHFDPMIVEVFLQLMSELQDVDLGIERMSSIPDLA